MLLKTERLLLREFEEDDWSSVLSYQTDPRYLRYSPWTERTEADAREFIGTFIAWRQEQPRTKFQFAIALLAEDRLIGTCGIRLARTVEPHSDRSSVWEADIGYELDSQFWGHGYATEAVRALLTFGFEQLGLHRIWAHCLAENTASIRLLERIGMRREGHLRENEWQQGRWHDTLTYAILAQEWEDKHDTGPR